MTILIALVILLAATSWAHSLGPDDATRK